MRALTLQPQWAHAVAHLGKRVENRSRPIPRALVGQRIAIHAGATLPPGWIDELRAHATVWGDSGKRRRGEPRYQPVAGTPDGWCAPIATRSIVAVATVRPHEPSAVEWREAGRGQLIADWRTTLPAWADAHAKEWWALTDVVALQTPVPVPRGQLGLWTLDPETEAAVRREEERWSAAQ